MMRSVALEFVERHRTTSLSAWPLSVTEGEASAPSVSVEALTLKFVFVDLPTGGAAAMPRQGECQQAAWV